MAEGDFGKYIQDAKKRRLIAPAVFIVFLFLIMHIFSIKNWLFPLKIAGADEAQGMYENGKSYVYCTPQRLLYTGIDHRKDGKVDGYYYYSLEDGRCSYYLIAARAKSAQPVLQNYSLNARILQEDELASDLDRLMAQQLGWTTDGVDDVTSDYILSEIDYNRRNIWLISVMIAVSFTGALAHIVVLLYDMMNPYAASDFRFLGDKNERRDVILEANREYNERVLFMSQGMYITDNYFIYHAGEEFAIVPLEDITWAYKHSSLWWAIGTKHFITYNVRLVTIYHKTYVFRGKTKESCDGLLDSLAIQHPEILIGYSQENKIKINKND